MLTINSVTSYQMYVTMASFPEEKTSEIAWTQLGEYHRQELQLDDGRFQRFFRLDRYQLGSLLLSGHHLYAISFWCPGGVCGPPPQVAVTVIHVGRADPNDLCTYATELRQYQRYFSTISLARDSL